ncbi:MAG: hypothetical protein ABI782_04710 [Anaerolineaceae bacterium]
MTILRTLLRIPAGIIRLLLKLVRKAVKLTLLVAVAGALLMLLDTLLLDAHNDRPAS